MCIDVYIFINVSSWTWITVECAGVNSPSFTSTAEAEAVLVILFDFVHSSESLQDSPIVGQSQLISSWWWLTYQPPAFPPQNSIFDFFFCIDPPVCAGRVQPDWRGLQDLLYSAQRPGCRLCGPESGCWAGGECGTNCWLPHSPGEQVMTTRVRRECNQPKSVVREQ